MTIYAQSKGTSLRNAERLPKVLFACVADASCTTLKTSVDKHILERAEPTTKRKNARDLADESLVLIPKHVRSHVLSVTLGPSREGFNVDSFSNTQISAVTDAESYMSHLPSPTESSHGKGCTVWTKRFRPFALDLSVSKKLFGVGMF